MSAPLIIENGSLPQYQRPNTEALKAARQFVEPVYGRPDGLPNLRLLQPDAPDNAILTVLRAVGYQDAVALECAGDAPLLAVDADDTVPGLVRLSPWEPGLDQKVTRIEHDPDTGSAVIRVAPDTTEYQLFLALQRFVGVSRPGVDGETVHEHATEPVRYFVQPSELNPHIAQITRIQS